MVGDVTIPFLAVAFAVAGARDLAGEVFGVIMLKASLSVRETRKRRFPGGSHRRRRSEENRGSLGNTSVAGDRRRHERRVRRDAKALLSKLHNLRAFGLGAKYAWSGEI